MALNGLIKIQKTIIGVEKMNKKEIENLIVLTELEIIYWKNKIKYFTNPFNDKTWKKELKILKIKLLELKNEQKNQK